jgi:hypothetical protein
MRNNVIIEKNRGGLGRRSPSADMVSAIVMNGIAVTGKIGLGEVHELRSVKDAEALGLDAAYDTTNNVLVFERINRYFMRNPSGELHIMLVAQSVTLAQMCDKALDYGKKLLKGLKGRVRHIAFARNPATGYTPTLTGGLDADVLAAIAKAQELHDDEFLKFRYANFFIEGRSFNGTPASATNLRSLNAENVSVVIGADPEVSGRAALFNGYAAVEEFLGMVSKAAVSQNVGELIPEFNLTYGGTWRQSGLSSNLNLDSYQDTALDQLHEKGYIFAEAVADVDGFYWNDTHTCTLDTSDYAYVENNSTVNKMIREVRRAILPKVKSRFRVDPDSGEMEASTRMAFEADAREAMKPMEEAGDLSGGRDAYIEPGQNLLSLTEWKMEVTAIPMAIGRKIKIGIGFSNPNNA